MFHMTWNGIKIETDLEKVTELLQRRLPEGWRLEVVLGGARRSTHRGSIARADASLTIQSPDGSLGTWALEAKRDLEPRDVSHVLAQRRRNSDEPIVVVAPFIGEEAQRRLAESGASYADATGNIRLVLERPSMYIELKGATKNPQREKRSLQSLKGPGANRVVRALCDFLPPYGIRELSARANLPIGSISRVVDLLAREALLERDTKGQVQSVEWPAILHRWSRDYDVLTSNTVVSYFAPRGVQHLLSMLPACPESYAVTGSLAASAKAPIAPPRLALIYVRDVPAFAEAMNLRAVDANANVLLILPNSAGAFERTWQAQGVEYAGLSQVAGDLMNSPGRGPAEAEALIKWMKEHADVWRT